MNAPRHSRLLRLNSRHLERPVHLWCHGWWGRPVLVIPSASGMAHEWQLGGAIEALQPWIDAGAIKLYCVETNVSRSWLADGPAHYRFARHLRWTRFVQDELLSFIDDDLGTPGMPIITAGASFGAVLALNLALQHPERFPQALCLSGRFELGGFLDDSPAPDADWSDIADEANRQFPSRRQFLEAAWFAQPLAHVPGLHGADFERVRSRFSATLVVGQGAYEGRCLPETLHMASVLRRKGLDATLDVWGTDVSHEWVWWRRQLVWHLPRMVAAQAARRAG